MAAFAFMLWKNGSGERCETSTIAPCRRADPLAESKQAMKTGREMAATAWSMQLLAERAERWLGLWPAPFLVATVRAKRVSYAC